jgi:CheY-like chemotaxis protein
VSPAHWILVVDDDDDVREMLVLVLGLEGYRVQGARDGQDALERIQARGRPDLVLLDLRMPRLSGPDFARLLRSDPATASIAIVVLSGDAHASRTASELEASGCMRKPVDLAELTAVVARLAPAAR